MKLFLRLLVILLSLVLVGVLVLGIYKHTSMKNTVTEAEDLTTEVKLEISQDSSLTDLSSNGDLISAVYKSDGMYHAALFSLNGALLKELCQSEDTLSAAFLSSGQLAVRCSDELDVWDVQSNEKVNTFQMDKGAIPDADGQAVWNVETERKNNEMDMPETYITKAIGTSGDNTQTVLDMPDGTTALVYAKYPYLYYKKEASDYKQFLCRINLDTQEKTELSDWVRGNDTPIGHVTKLFQSEILMPWELPDKMFVTHRAEILGRDGVILLLRQGDSFFVIDAEKKTLLLQVPYDGEISVNAVNGEKQYIVLGDASSATVYPWKGEGTPTDMAELVDLGSISDAIQAQREDLLAVHGITVTNDETLVGEYFQPKTLESQLRSYVAGIELTDFFQLLPPGLTDEMRPEALQTFPVCLTGYMTCVGLSIPYEEEYYMALDVNFLYDSFIYNDPTAEESSAFIDTLPHEFLHMLEYHITQTTLPDGKPILSLWDAVVPPDDGETFTGTYEGDWDAANSLDSSSPAEDIWFENAYSRTMPEEDRATLFSCLYSGVHSNGEGWDVYPHLLEKGQLLCAIIRESYPSVKATPEGSMYWERNFEQKPLSAFLPQEQAA